MGTRLVILAALVVALAACGGDSTVANDPSPSDTQANDASTSTDASETTLGGSGNGESDGVAGVDLSSLGAPPVASAQSAVAEVDGTSYTFDGTELGAARCEVSNDRIAVNIGQSQDWFAFVATATGDTWSAGPSFALEDEPQHEGLTPGSAILVDGETVTFQGEIVVKVDATDFDSWQRTVGSVTVNCSTG